MRCDSFVDTEVGNDADFTANTTASAEFAGTVSAEGFVGNPGLNRCFLIVVAMLLVASSCSRPREEVLLKKIGATDDRQKRVALQHEFFGVGEPAYALVIEDAAEKDHSHRFTACEPGRLYGLMTINGPRYYFHDLGKGLDGECEQLNRRLHARLEKDDDYLRRFIEACSPGNGIYMEECIDELLDEESLPSSRRIAQAYLRDYENLKLDFNPLAPLSEMPKAVRQQILDWKKAHYEGSFWKDSDLREAEWERELAENPEHWSLKPAVQFSCAVHTTPEEDALEADLRGEDVKKRLAALEKAVEYTLPSSVPLQYAAYGELKKTHPEHEAIRLAAERFGPAWIESVLSADPPQDPYRRTNRKYYWAIRAVGVTKHERLVPRLVELSRANNLDTYLAAERSIEDFEGKQGEDALIEVIRCWQYDAFLRAARTLRKRNPRRLAEALDAMDTPKNRQVYFGLLLARSDNSKSVPILCKTVKGYQRIDREIFDHIARLGRQEDKRLIEALPEDVRENQKEMAQRCVDRYHERLGK